MGCVSSKHFSRKHTDCYSSVPAPHDWEERGVLDFDRDDSFFEFHGVPVIDKYSYEDAPFGLHHRQDYCQHVSYAEEGNTFDFMFASVHEMKQMLLYNKDEVKVDSKSLRNGLFVQQQHYDDVDPEAMEIINTWELMEGLEDLSRTPSPLRGYGGGKQERTPSPLRGYNGSKLTIPKRTILFNGQDLSSGDFESPVWKKYYIQECAAKDNPSFDGIATSPFNDSPRRPVSGNGLDDTANISSMELFDGENTAGLKFLLNSTNSSPCFASPLEKRGTFSTCDGEHENHQSEMAMFDVDAKCLYTEYPYRSQGASPYRSQGASPYRSQVVSPYRSPNARILSRQRSYGSTSPLFDPALMATFEQALHATINSEFKHQWLQSSTGEASIGMESLDTTSNSDNLFKSCKGANYCYSASKIEEGESCFRTSLDSYPQRCPPRGDAKVVLYFTSLRGIRKTYQECCYLRLILRGLRVQVDERDVWMHSKFKEELSDLIGNEVNGSAWHVPQLFINGRYIGGADEVKQLHEEGILAKLIDGFATNAIQNICHGCGDARFIPCLVCNGSCKVNQQFGVSRCWECNENGLIMCPICVT